MVEVTAVGSVDVLTIADLAEEKLGICKLLLLPTILMS